MNSNIICPYLIGGSNGITCSVVSKFIRDTEDADIRLCMNRRYEVCSIYVRQLQKEALKYINPGAVTETP